MSAVKTTIQKVLLLDDDRDDCEIFEQVLLEVNPSLQLYCLHKAEALLEAIKTQQPDIIFLDMNMPKINGIECLRMLYKEGICNTIPVVIYSDSENPKEIEIAYKLGATLYFRKQAQMAELVQRINQIVHPSKRA